MAYFDWERRLEEAWWRRQQLEAEREDPDGLTAGGAWGQCAIDIGKRASTLGHCSGGCTTVVGSREHPTGATVCMATWRRAECVAHTPAPAPPPFCHQSDLH